MIFGPRQSRTGAPPLSTGFETRRYGGIHSCSCTCEALVREGSSSPAAATMSAMCAPVPPEIE